MFGKRLKELRLKKGLTIEELAEKIGLTRSTYGGYETEKRKPQLETIIKLANFHNTSTDYILGLTSNPISNKEDNDFKRFLDSKTLTWDGIPLKDEELKPIKDIMEIVVRDRLPKHKF